MAEMHNLSIFIFTRDLRLSDNTGLNKALAESKKIIPVFIFNKLQIDDDENKYKSNNCVQFMCECLDDLNDTLKNKYDSRLFIFYGYIDDILTKLIAKHNINAIYMNKDYTPFAIKRENVIGTICKKNKCSFNIYDDYLLVGQPDSVKNENDEGYKKFTPFYNRAKKIKIDKPYTYNKNKYIHKKNTFEEEYKKDYHRFYKKNNNLQIKGGRTEGLKIIKNITNYKNYNNTRDYPILNTTNLSAYLKFNVISIRETYHAFKTDLGTNNKLIQQLYWRDFYMIITYNYPHVIGNSMKEKYDDIEWDNDIKLFNNWKKGTTGIPIIDAGMRQLNTIGWMHNRTRMITSNFLVKVMHIDWKKGEKYFAQNLIDYDPANNNGGWQWSASTGTDSQPYFRYFNPFLQSKKYDNECKYIKKWIPELKDVENNDIHKWNEAYKKYPNVNYPKPIIQDIQKEIKKTINMFGKY